MRENNNGNIQFYIALAVFFIISVLGLTYMIQNSNSNDERGTFGDMFGFANALFTGLSFIGLIGTILLQRKDLNNQREEIQKQNDSTYKQNFDNTFFNLINLQSKIVDNMRVNIENKVILPDGSEETIKEKYEGLGVFMKKYADFYKLLDANPDAHINIYEVTYILSNYVVGPYFTSLYRLIKFVDEDIHFSFKEKYKYVSVIRSQLTVHQTAFLFYHCLHVNIKFKFKPLVEKYAFFNNLEDTYIIKDHRKLYADSAYNLDKIAS